MVIKDNPLLLLPLTFPKGTHLLQGVQRVFQLNGLSFEPITFSTAVKCPNHSAAVSLFRHILTTNKVKLGLFMLWTAGFEYKLITEKRF